MKDYRLLLAGLILLLLAVCIAIFVWLWTSNRKNTDPLPITTNEGEPKTMTEDSEDTAMNHTLYVRAEENLQIPLDDVIVSFESRYPHIQVLANYVPSTALLTLSSHNTAKDTPADLGSITDVIIANNEGFSAQRLSDLQLELEKELHTPPQSQKNTNVASIDNVGENNEGNNVKENNEDNQHQQLRRLTPFNYALRDEQALEGVILTDNTIAISFRNFLLSSTGQDILKKYDYENISGYKNSVNDLFEPMSRSKQAAGNNNVDVADALSNGE